MANNNYSGFYGQSYNYSYDATTNGNQMNFGSVTNPQTNLASNYGYPTTSDYASHYGSSVYGSLNDPSYSQQPQQQSYQSQAYGYTSGSSYNQGGTGYYGNYQTQPTTQIQYEQPAQVYGTTSQVKETESSFETPSSSSSAVLKEDDEKVPLFGIDLSKPSGDQQNQLQQQFQQVFQQAFEKQLHQQIQQMVMKNLGQPSESKINFGDESGSFFGTQDKSKFYCSTCDINYANSLAFTSHMGSKEHKITKERFDREPLFREEMLRKQEIRQKQLKQQQQQQQQQQLRGPPGKKVIPCKLCNTVCYGTDQYAQHIKSYEHQQSLKMSIQTRKKQSYASNYSSHDYHNNYRDGLEFIEELRDEMGNVLRVFCNLCKFDIDNDEMKILHLKGQKHNTLLRERMEKDGIGGSFGNHYQDIIQQQLQQHIQEQVQQQIKHHLQNFIPQLPLEPEQQEGFIQQVQSQMQLLMKQPQFIEQFEQQITQQFPSTSSFSSHSSGHDFRSSYHSQSYRPRNYHYSPRSYRPPYRNFHRIPYQYNPYIWDRRKQNMIQNSGEKESFGIKLNSTPDWEDQLVKQKHAIVYPTSFEFKEVQKVLVNLEKWLIQLKLQRQHKQLITESSPDVSIKCVKRINNVAKGLLLRSNLTLDLLLLASDWPTYELVWMVFNELETIIEKGHKDSFMVEMSDKKDYIIIKKKIIGKCFPKPAIGPHKPGESANGSEEEITIIKCNIFFSCEDLKEKFTINDADKINEEDKLSLSPCLQLLDQLEQTKWFQTNANTLPCCVLVLRVVKHLIIHYDKFKQLDEMFAEIVMEKTLSSYKQPIKPGKAFRIFVESLAQGVLLNKEEREEEGEKEEKGEKEEEEKEREEEKEGEEVKGKIEEKKNDDEMDIDEKEILEEKGLQKNIEEEEKEEKEKKEESVVEEKELKSINQQTDDEKTDNKNDNNTNNNDNDNVEKDNKKSENEIKEEKEENNEEKYKKKTEFQTSKYDFVVDYEDLEDWWNKNSNVLSSISTEKRKKITHSAKEVLELINTGYLCEILELGKKKILFPTLPNTNTTNSSNTASTTTGTTTTNTKNTSDVPIISCTEVSNKTSEVISTVVRTSSSSTISSSKSLVEGENKEKNDEKKNKKDEGEEEEEEEEVASDNPKKKRQKFSTEKE